MLSRLQTGDNPMSAIMILENGSYYTESRGNKMTLIRNDWDQWEMYTDNASHRAYQGPGVRVFNSLKEVEKHYKSWRGISALVEMITNAEN
jgi:hypothetical protein